MEYVEGCAICQENKPFMHRNNSNLVPITPEHQLPFQTVAMDFITDLPKSEGFDSCLVVTDHDCTKMLVFVLYSKTCTTSDTATLLWSDGGTLFLPLASLS